MGKSERVEQQESLQTTGGQQATDVRRHYCRYGLGLYK